MTHRMHPLHDRIAIVIDASHGVGAEIARHLARTGARVVLNYRPAQRRAAQQLEEEIFGSGGRAWAVPANPRNENEVRFLLEQTASGFGEPDVIIVADEAADAALPHRFGMHADKVWTLQAPWFLPPSCPSVGSLAADAAYALHSTIDAAVTHSLQQDARNMEQPNPPVRRAEAAFDDMTELRPRRTSCTSHAPDDATQTVLAAARLGSGRRRRRLSIRS